MKPTGLDLRKFNRFEVIQKQGSKSDFLCIVLDYFLLGLLSIGTFMSMRPPDLVILFWHF